MDKKKILIVVVSVVVLAGIFVGIGAFVTGSSNTEAVKKAQTEEDTGVIENKKDTGAAEKSVDSGSADIEAAKGLIEQTVSRDEIEEAVGEWDDFEMSSKGCERGVYSGKFFYKDFIIHSRTYDKGKTFYVTAVN